jgi:DHA1 family bicyclomycin/chloramphenicol resistance-like MFS transporter
MKHRVLVVILAALSMLGALSIDAYLPALPTIAHDYGVPLAAAQQTLTIYIFAFGFMSLFYGTLSDSFGRRPVVLASLVLYLISSIGAAVAPSLAWLLFFRACQGLTAGAGSVVGPAMVADLFTGAEAQRILAYIWTVFGVAPAVAPILGGWLLASSGWHSIFYFIAAFTFVLLIACVIRLPESLPAARRQEFHPTVIVRNYLLVGSNYRFLAGSIGNALAFTGIMTYVACAPVYVLDILHLSVKQFGWVFVTFISGMSLGSAASGRYSDRFKPATTIRIGFAFMAVSSAVSLFYTALCEQHIPWAVIPLFFYGFGASFATPAMTILLLEMFPHIKGLPSSFQTFAFLMFFSFISGALAPLLYGSAFRLALAVAMGVFLSYVLWKLAARGMEDHPVLTPEEKRLADEAPHL